MLVNLLLVVVGAIAVAVAVLGPLLVRAVAQSTVEQATGAAAADSTAIGVSLQLNGSDPTSGLATAGHVLQAGSSGHPGFWTPAQLWTGSTQNLAWKATGHGTGEQTSRVRLTAGDCAGLVVVAGRCPTADGEAAVSTADATTGGVRIGSEVTLRSPSTTIGPGTPAKEVVVVGTYDAGRSQLPRAIGDDGGNGAVATSSPIVLTGSQAAALSVPVQILGRLDLRTGLRVQDEPKARAAVAAVRQAVLQESDSVAVTTGLTDLLDRADAEIRSAGLLVAVTEAQALAVALFALAVVLQRIALTRAAEWGIGRLRGVPRARWYTSIYVEPGAALVLGSLVGLVVGTLAARASVTASLGSSTPVEPGRWPVLVAAAAVLVAFGVELVAVSAPSLRRPLVELIQQRSESRRLGVAGAVAQSAVLLAAAASLYQLLAGGVLSTGGSQLGLLAPALLALSLGLIAVRVAVLLVRRVTARPPRSLGALVVGRQAARTPSSLNPAVVVAVGTALAVFATQIFLASARNQDLRASAVVGAQTVLAVQVPPDANLLSLVRAADPGGRSAMAAQQRSVAADTGVARVLAVDTSRLGAVAAWSSRWSGTDDLASLGPSSARTVELEGSRIEVNLSGVDLKPGAVSIAGTAPADPTLLVTVDTGAAWKTIALGSITSAAHRAALPCSSGCRLVSIGVQSAPGAAYTADLTITSVSTDRQPVAANQGWLHDPGWHARVGDLLSASPRAQATPTVTTAGLHLATFDQDGGSEALALPADAIDPLPALVAPATDAQPFPGLVNAVSGRGLDGEPQLLQVVGNASVLPRLLDDGVLVDLANADKLADPAQGQRADEVWLAPGAPPQIEQALAAEGVTVTGRDDLEVQERTLRRGPSTRSASAARSLGLAALALTLVALVAARAADAARRRPDWKSLLDGGLPARTVRRLAFTEIATPVVAGVLLGVLSGVLGFVLAAPRLPLVDLTTAGPPLDLHVARTEVVVIGVGVLVVTMTVSGVASRLETRTGEGRP